MLRNKLSHVAILEEQVEKLQDLANQFSAITGHSIEEVEDDIVRLLIPRIEYVCPNCKATYQNKWDFCFQCGQSPLLPKQS